MTLCFAIFAGVLVASLVAAPDQEENLESSAIQVKDEAQKAVVEMKKYFEELIKNFPRLPDNLKEQLHKAFEEAKKLLDELLKELKGKDFNEVTKYLSVWAAKIMAAVQQK